MKRSKHVRLTRELASSLLNSSLSERELADLCHDILSNGPIVHEVAESILNLIGPLGREHTPRDSSYSEYVQDEARSAYNWLKGKGITKDKLFIALSMFNRDMDDFINLERPTIKEAMEFFIDKVSTNEFHHFMQSFNDDDFIRMIEER
ncbi:hypothetical protein ACHELK_004439 [Vibrio vulnificus]|uniref:hypothetical protein n=1 Tax=Vibrio vulnificus TaxID=672 RepID=UPI00092C7E23|nr:hypothetical protein [Vibrio vulnificus]EJV9416057.1 hypothetical protein [Vibrio vulnificus]OJI37216.1 hypothetical protein VVDAL7940_02120 [Vibrio vulnificus]